MDKLGDQKAYRRTNNSAVPKCNNMLSQACQPDEGAGLSQLAGTQNMYALNTSADWQRSLCGALVGSHLLWPDIYLTF